MNTFEFNGVNCAEYGAYVHSMYPANVARRSEEIVQIPGKNGDLVLPNGSFQNVEVEYQVFFKSDYMSNYAALVAALLSVDGYAILRDSRNENYFRMARLTNWESDVVSRDLVAGAAVLTFDCMPQRFLVSGLVIQTFLQSGYITNQTSFTAKPNIRVYGYGTVTIGNVTITIQQNQLEYIDIDCEAMAAFNGAVNANSLVSMSSDSFPVLAPGTTGISMTGNVSSIQIQPRWWTV